MNSSGPRKSIRYNREFVITVRECLCSKVVIWNLKSEVKFIRIRREFVVTVIVLTEFDCSIIWEKPR